MKIFTHVQHESSSSTELAWLIKIASVAKKPKATRQKAKCDVNVSVDVDVEMWPPPESG